MLIGIVGTGRNGSTLLLRLLDGVPGTYTHPIDINFLSELNDLASLGYESRDVGLTATTKPLGSLTKPVITEILLKIVSSHSKEMEKDYISKISDIVNYGIIPISKFTKPNYTVKEFLPLYLRSFSEWLNDYCEKHKFIFKTTETSYIQEYENMFGSIRFIHIIRDPVETYISQKRTLMIKKSLPSYYLGGDNLGTMIDKRWRTHAELILKKCPSDKHYLLRYEDLIKRPVEEIKKICEWLGVSMPDKPDEQTVLGGRRPKSLPSNPSQKGLDTPAKVDPNLQKKYGNDEVITKRERNLIIYKTNHLARKLGFFNNEVKPSLFRLLLNWIIPDKWEFMNVKGFKERLNSMKFMILRRYHLLKMVVGG